MRDIFYQPDLSILGNPNIDIEKLYYDFKKYFLDHHESLDKNLSFWRSDFLDFMNIDWSTYNTIADKIIVVWVKLGFIKRLHSVEYHFGFLK